MSRHRSLISVGLALTLWLAGCGEVEVARDAATVTPDGSGPVADARVEADGGVEPAVCGDGQHEGDEQCDDGNADDSDGCTVDCLLAGAIGCADGRRDGYLGLSEYPDIAGCAGAWTVAGLAQPRTTCAGGGDDDPSPGQRCAAADLCAGGWHICSGAAEVAARTGEAGCADAVAGDEALFFATQQGSSGNALCDGAGENDLFGCGSLGATPSESCVPLDHFSGNTCGALGNPWQCPDSFHELATVTKPAPAAGGILCCRD